MARSPDDRRRLLKRLSLLLLGIVAGLVLAGLLATLEQKEPEVATRYKVTLEGKSW